MLRVDRTSPEFAATEDPTCYTKPQLQRLLATLNAGELRQRGRETDGSRAACLWGCCLLASGNPLDCTLRTLRASPLTFHPAHLAPAQATSGMAGCSLCARRTPSSAACSFWRWVLQRLPPSKVMYAGMRLACLNSRSWRASTAEACAFLPAACRAPTCCCAPSGASWEPSAVRGLLRLWLWQPTRGQLLSSCPASFSHRLAQPTADCSEQPACVPLLPPRPQGVWH